MTAKGAFISFEGIDGSGKSTQIRLLSDHLMQAGHDVVVTREPGGSPGAEEIRALVLQGASDRWSPETELLLFTAARRDHLERLILPALDAGKIVLCDRFADSTRLYQGATRSALRETVDALHDLMIGREPDLTILVDLDPETGLSRALSRKGQEERFEGMGQAMQAVIRQGFLDLAAASPQRFRVIDGARDKAAVALDIARAVDKFLATTTGTLASGGQAAT